jgi:hypothetical protein
LGVNFHYNGPTVDTTFQGIDFDNIDLAGAGALTDTHALGANPLMAGASVTLDFDFTGDNTPRFQTAGITGPDAATLDAVANEFFYVSGSGVGHDRASMTFDGLWPEHEVYVQVFGGDSGWNGDLEVLVNGTHTANWTTVADSNGGTASVFGFFAETDALGQLQLDFTVNSGNFAGIGGMLITQRVPEPSALALASLGLFGLPLFRRRRS